MIVFDAIAKKVLTVEQQALQSLLAEFAKTHFLVDGTAIALQLGHRKSLDFDFFTLGPQGSGKELAERIARAGCVLDEGSELSYLSDAEESEATIFVRGVKIQLIDFSRNPFGVQISIPHEKIICGEIKTPGLLDLAALKVFAMMYRKKWKDAVDLFFLLQQTSQKITFTEVLQRAKTLFTKLYQEIVTLETILEDDWDYSESVEYLCENPPTDATVREFLVTAAKEYLR
jgi:hypothetical protein